MKASPWVLALGIFASSVASADPSGPGELAVHHAVIGMSRGQVEIYWIVPAPSQRKLPVVVYLHGVQGEDRPGAKNFVEGGL